MSKSAAQDDSGGPRVGAVSTEPPEEGAPAWVITFSDLMSLLLTFFVLLYSMSEIRIERFAAARDSLNAAFTGMGIVDSKDPAAPSSADDNPPPVSDPVQIDLENVDSLADDILDEIAERLREMIRERELEETLTVERTEDGVVLLISTSLFPSGSALMEDGSRWIIRELAEITAELSVPAVVSGHTDDAPIQTSVFASNWELSAARAAGVARGLVEAGYDAQHLTVEAYGEHRPTASNDSPEGRSQNRRVEMFFSRDAIVGTLRERLRAGLSPRP